MVKKPTNEFWTLVILKQFGSVLKVQNKAHTEKHMSYLVCVFFMFTELNITNLKLCSSTKIKKKKKNC